MKMIRVSTKWAIAEHHIVDVWLGGEGEKTLNIAYDVPNMKNGTITYNSAKDAQDAYARVLAQIDKQSTILDEEDD